MFFFNITSYCMAECQPHNNTFSIMSLLHSCDEIRDWSIDPKFNFYQINHNIGSVLVVRLNVFSAATVNKLHKLEAHNLNGLLDDNSLVVSLFNVQN